VRNETVSEISSIVSNTANKTSRERELEEEVQRLRNTVKLLQQQNAQLLMVYLHFLT
jgi:hypothetical protein